MPTVKPIIQKSTLYQALTHLSKRDAQRFGQWLSSPLHNQDTALTRFWEYLAECHWQFDMLPEQQKGFTIAYPDTAYAPQKMRLLMSKLYKQLEQYLAFAEMHKDDHLQQQHLARALRHRKLWKHCKRTLDRAGQLLDKKPERNASHYRQQLRLQEEAHHLLSTNDPTEAEHLQQMATQMDVAYLIQRLRHSCLLLAHSNVYQAGFSPGPMPALLAYAQSADLLDEPAVALYYHCYQMLTQEEPEESFRAFTRTLLAHGDCVSASELRDLYLLATNHCVREANNGKLAYYHDLFELYKQGLASAALLENGTLSRFAYHNIVTAGIRVEEYDWLEQFITDYQQALERPYRVSSYSYSLARLAYSRQQYGRALQLLQKANYRDPLLNLVCKTLQLKIYYDSDETDLLAAHLDAMTSYIRRKKVIGYHRTNYQNLIRYTRKLMNANPYHKPEILTLRTAVAREEILTERDWLAEQVAALL